LDDDVREIECRFDVLNFSHEHDRQFAPFCRRREGAIESSGTGNAANQRKLSADLFERVIQHPHAFLLYQSSDEQKKILLFL